MSFSVGIVGLPNVGKSTLFKALTKKQVDIADYPFTTIKPNIGVVQVPDERLEKIAEIIKPAKVTPTIIEFVDIAGLVEGAHKGEGLGNQFLAKIREVNAIVHLIRTFEDKSVSHYYASIDPQRDKEIIDLELKLAEIKKPILYVLNTNDEKVGEIEEGMLKVCAKTGQGIEKLIQETYQLLNLITFYTIKGGRELTAWSLQKGQTASDAAGRVHTDMAKGFIKAEVISFENLMQSGSWLASRNEGKIRLEGKDYVIQDGDVVEFKFNL